MTTRIIGITQKNLSDIVKRWEAAHPYDPRKKMGNT
jgi:hypothetical protein